MAGSDEERMRERAASRSRRDAGREMAAGGLGLTTGGAGPPA